jgi:hypothetical protein
VGRGGVLFSSNAGLHDAMARIAGDDDCDFGLDPLQ